MNKIEFNKYKVKEQKKHTPSSERAYWISRTAKRLKIPFRSVLYKTIDWELIWIKEMYLHCDKADNFGRLWFGLIKKHK